mmetsp:Transcript_17858/g.27773  ORF Transcript_17858/g.27773 Transcript_17858/m.27773 type:complete len:104 (+) Transcript_17858:224-535(+)
MISTKTISKSKSTPDTMRKSNTMKDEDYDVASTIAQHRNAVTKFNLEKPAVDFVRSESMFEGRLTQKELHDIDSVSKTGSRRYGFVVHLGANGAKIGHCAFVT